jgi:hypothetical protein
MQSQQQIKSEHIDINIEKELSVQKVLFNTEEMMKDFEIKNGVKSL